jgi:hypothetical protein
VNEHQTHHWQRVREIFDRASELSGDARNLLVAELCAQEPSNIRNDVAKLLSIQKESGLAIDRPVLRPVKNAQVQKGDTLANGRYRLLRFVASGGMGEVYAAHDTQTGRDVAVKFLRQFSLVSAQQEQIRARFEREAKLAGQIHHPNVCRIDAVYMDEDPPFCVMDLLQGETLAARLASKGRYTPAEALPIVEKICEGLDVAHARQAIDRLASVRYRILQIEAELVYRKALLAQGKNAQQATAAVLASARAFGFPEPVETFGGRVDLRRLWSAERTVIMRPARRP